MTVCELCSVLPAMCFSKWTVSPQCLCFFLDSLHGATNIHSCSVHCGSILTPSHCLSAREPSVSPQPPFHTPIALFFPLAQRVWVFYVGENGWKTQGFLCKLGFPLLTSRRGYGLIPAEHRCSDYKHNVCGTRPRCDRKLWTSFSSEADMWHPAKLCHLPLGWREICLSGSFQMCRCFL